MEALPQLHFRNYLKKWCSTTAFMRFHHRNFFQLSATSRPQCFKEALLHNCLSALPQSTAEVRTEKIVELRLRTFKIGLPHLCTVSRSRLQIWIPFHNIKTQSPEETASTATAGIVQLSTADKVNYTIDNQLHKFKPQSLAHSKHCQQKAQFT
jgi:hypothetical protein